MSVGERLNGDAQRIVDLALREALSLGHNYIGPEHLLLGMARHQDNAASIVLRYLGHDSEAIRNAVIAHVANRGARKPTVVDVEELGRRLLKILDELSGPAA